MILAVRLKKESAGVYKQIKEIEAELESFNKMVREERQAIQATLKNAKMRFINLESIYHISDTVEFNGKPYRISNIDFRAYDFIYYGVRVNKQGYSYGYERLLGNHENIKKVN